MVRRDRRASRRGGGRGVMVLDHRRRVATVEQAHVDAVGLCHRGTGGSSAFGPGGVRNSDHPRPLLVGHRQGSRGSVRTPTADGLVPRSLVPAMSVAGANLVGKRRPVASHITRCIRRSWRGLGGGEDGVAQRLQLLRVVAVVDRAVAQPLDQRRDLGPCVAAASRIAAARGDPIVSTSSSRRRSAAIDG